MRNPLVLGLALAVHTGTLQAQPRLVSSYVTRDASGRMVRVDQWDDRPAVPAMLPLPAVPLPPARIASDPLPPPTGTAPYQNQQSTQTTNVFLGGQPAASPQPAFAPSRAYVPPAAPVREVHYAPPAEVVREVYHTAPARVYVPRAPAYAPVKTKTYAPAAVYPAAAPVQYVPVPVEAPRRGGLLPSVYRFFFG